MADMQSLAHVAPGCLKRLLGDIPGWVTIEEEFQRAAWLNVALEKLWPKIDEAVRAIVEEHVTPVLQEYKPEMLSSLGFDTFTLGTIPPIIGGVKVRKAEMCQEDEVVMEVDFKWGGDPDIVLAIRTVGVSLPIQVKNLNLFGKARVQLRPLLDNLYMVGAVTIALLEKPFMDFNLKVVGGDIMSVPGLNSALSEFLRTTIVETLVWPRRIVIPIVGNYEDYDYLQQHLVGVLKVRLVEAVNLHNTDRMGKADPFAILNVRSVNKLTSSVKSNTLNPRWDEEFTFLVEDLGVQSLHIKVMDKDIMRASELIGKAVVPLLDLAPYEEREVWQDLYVGTKNIKAQKSRGKVHLLMTYAPFTDKDDVRAAESNDPYYAKLNMEAGKLREGLGGALFVKVEKAVKICAPGQTVNAYVKLRLMHGYEVKKTMILDRESEPQWNENYELMCQDPTGEILELRVWNKRKFGKALIGVANIGLKEVAQRGQIRGCYALSQCVHPGAAISVCLEWRSLSWDRHDVND
eukprot:jgi/Mesvir1/26671/Mv20455-RA.1